MTGNKGVIFALVGRWERLQATELAVCVETVATACKYLVAVCLMPHIPYEFVVGSRKHIVKSNRKLNRAEARCEMAGVIGQ